MHKSVCLDSPIEFINITPLNPLISKCQIKVCYVGDEPNRNKSIITKEVAKQMANSLPGCPIVGFFNEDKQDFEGHNRIIDVSNGEFKIKDTTRPYGFVDLGAKVWFQKFLDDDKDEREYLMTEGWLWTGQYPECQRIIDKGNNQSMELDENILNANWTKDDNGNLQFFIIHEAIIAKLCTLGEAVEPCFEGAGITAPTIQFSLDDKFKDELRFMMNELKELLKNEGGEKVFTRYSVEIGDTLWNALFDHVNGTYSIVEVCEDGEQKFAIVTSEDKYYRLNFSIAEDGSVEFAEAEAMDEYTPSEDAQFDATAVEEYAKAKNTPPASKEDEEDDEEKCPDCGKPKSECTCKKGDKSEGKTEDEEDKSEGKKDDEDEDEEEKKKKGKKGKYNLDEIQEYVELSEKYSLMENELNDAKARITSLEEENASLTTFKKSVEKVEKQKMIDSFYVLSDEDKADVVANIDNYSLEDIEAKLSIICVRKKVSFDLNDNGTEDKKPTTFNLDGGMSGDEDTPAWVKALRSVAKDM